MDAQQEGVEVAGQNMANANNPAYAREQLVLQSSLSIPTSSGMEGTGVDASSITEVRDILLDQQIQAETSVTGSLTSQQTALQYVQDALGEQLESNASTNASGTSSVGTPGGLNNDLSGLFNAFQTLSTDPSSLTDRQAVIAAGQQLASDFNQVNEQLSSLNTQLNQSVQTGVASANQLLSQIAGLNQQIVAAQAATGGTANTLIDQRQQDIESLANLVNVQTTANSDGSMNLSVDGTVLVSGSNLEDTLQTYTTGGGQLLVATAGSPSPLTLTGGAIQGTIEARDNALATLQSGVNNLASQLVTQVNSIYSAGYDLDGNTGANFFTGTSAANIGLNSNLAGNPAALQASGVAGDAGNNQVALALAQLANTTQAGLNNQTFAGSYNETITNLGSSLSTVNNQLADQQSVQSMLTQQRSSESGVNMDEEMTNIVSFERAYQGSAELVTTLDQMLNMVAGMKQNP